MRILLHGCNGKMGQVITRILRESGNDEIVCGVDLDPSKHNNSYPVYASLEDVVESPDVLIDFSHHTCLGDLLKFGVKRNVPLVICTTGFDEKQKEAMKDAAEKIPVLHAPNMAVGVNLIISLAKQAARALYGDFDIEIVERHHNQKVDAPSGTALAIAEGINSALDGTLSYTHGRHTKTERRKKNELGIHAVRGGAIVGDHSVIFAGLGEVIEINHSAISRDVFAHGALRAARFLRSEGPGLYNMDHVIGNPV